MRFLSGSVTGARLKAGREGGAPCGLVKVKVKVSPAGQ